jgi:hypothetical protein
MIPPPPPPPNEALHATSCFVSIPDHVSGEYHGTDSITQYMETGGE